MQGHICSTLEGSRLRGGGEENLRLNFFISFFQDAAVSEGRKMKFCGQMANSWIQANPHKSQEERILFMSALHYALCMQHLYLSVYYT